MQRKLTTIALAQGTKHELELLAKRKGETFDEIVSRLIQQNRGSVQA